MANQTLNLFKYILLLLVSFSMVFGAPSMQQNNLVLRYFSHQLNIPSTDIEMKVLHAPDLDPDLIKKGEISVQGGQRNLNLGHQTIWLVHKSGSVVKKRWSMTVEIYAHLELPIATARINRLDMITSDMIRFESKRVGREYSRLVLANDDFIGKMASQSIRAGRALEKNMLKNAPDVLLGDELQIILLNNGISLALPGIAKEEALVGEELRVQCPSTRKEFRGVLQNPTEVHVSLR